MNEKVLGVQRQQATITRLQGTHLTVKREKNQLGNTRKRRVQADLEQYFRKRSEELDAICNNIEPEPATDASAVENESTIEHEDKFRCTRYDWRKVFAGNDR